MTMSVWTSTCTEGCHFSRVRCHSAVSHGRHESASPSRGSARSCRRGLELLDEPLWCRAAIGVFENLADLLPVDPVGTRGVEVHTKPGREGPARGWRRPEESPRLCGDEFFLHAGQRRAPQRDPTIAVVVVVEVAEWPPLGHEEAGFAVAQAFARVGQHKRDLAHTVERTLSLHPEARSLHGRPL